MSMKISLQNLGKRFNREWIFRHFDYEFISQKSYAITGPNGSGKSTLLQVMGGAITLSEGTVVYENIKPEDIYKHISIAAPYLELVEEMTLTEFFNFHAELKNWLPSITIKKILSVIELEKAADKQLRYFSSGMKQRLKLAQAFFSDTSVLLLDEPCTNLDEDGVQLYHRLINEYTLNRIVIVSSNDIGEYGFCKDKIFMGDIGRRQRSEVR